MALIGNRSVLLKSPGRFLSGTVASNERNNFTNGGQVANRFQSMSKIFGGKPTGHLSPSSWSLPRTGGAISSRNECIISIDAYAEGALGLNAVAEADLSITAFGEGALIASGIGLAIIAIAAFADVSGVLNGVGEASFDVSGNADIGAIGWLSGSGTAEISGSVDPHAIGHITGSTEDVSVLTPESVASAVWSTVIEAGYSAEDIVRLLAAYAAGDATGLDGTAEFTGLDGVTVRIEGAVSGATRTITALDAS